MRKESPCKNCKCAYLVENIDNTYTWVFYNEFVFSERKKCPCITCLVKAKCFNNLHWCNDFGIHYNYLTKLVYEKLKRTGKFYNQELEGKTHNE